MRVSNGAIYVGHRTTLKGKTVTTYLHRLVIGIPKEMVDHKNGDIFDCRRENLRVVTNSQNQMNSAKRKTLTSSIYKNVFWNKKLKKWKAQLRIDRQDFFLGYFENERHAAYAVELSRPILHGEHSRSNFSDDLVGMSFEFPGLNRLFGVPRSDA